MLMQNVEFKLSDQTRKIIQNFSNINPSMLFKPGKTLATIAPAAGILAFAEVEEEFPQAFAIYDLSRFLSILSTYDDPVLVFADKHVTIQTVDNNKRYHYRYTSESMIVAPPEGKIKVTDVLGSFELPAPALANLLKVMSISGHLDVTIACKDKVLFLQAIDLKEKKTDDYISVLGELDVANFQVRLQRDWLATLMTGKNYSVTVDKGFVRFTSAPLDYYIAVEPE